MSAAGAHGRVYNQFNELGSFNLKLEGTPNWGLPDGWGVFQVDSHSGAAITPRLLWDWQENVDVALPMLATYARAARPYEQGQRALANGAAIPDTGPEAHPGNCAFSNNGGHPFSDAQALQTYNGGPRTPPYFRWDAAAQPPAWTFHTYTSWFETVNGQRVEHRNQYVAGVCSQVEP